MDIRQKRRSFRWSSVVMAGVLAMYAAVPAVTVLADTPAITADTPIYYDRVDNVFPDVAASERMLNFFQQNLISNQQPDGRFDNFPQKVYVSGGNLTAGNITRNMGFEQDASGQPDRWNTTDGSGAAPTANFVTWNQDTAVALEGSGFVKMQTQTTDSAALVQNISNPLDVLVDYSTPANVSVAANSLMIFSAFYKTDQLVASAEGQGVYGKVTFLDVAGQPIGTPYVFKGDPAASGWQEIRGLVTVPSQKPAQIVVQAGVDQSQGTVLWDGIRLMRVDTSAGTDGIPYATKGTAAVPNAGFESSSSWTATPQESGAPAIVTPSTSGGYSGKGGQIISNAADTVALLSNTLSASSNGTRQFGGDYRIFSVKYKTDLGFSAADGRGVEARMVYLDQNKVQIGSTSFYGTPTNGQWGVMSGVFDTPYPVYSVRMELRIQHAQGTVTFDNVSYIGVDQQNSSTEAGFGTVGMLAYNWSRTGKSDAMLAKRANDGLAYYLKNRVTAVDNLANASKLQSGKANSGEYYVPYSVSGSTTGADYPTTAFGLHNLATAIGYGDGLFTQDQMDDAKTKAKSMWNWLIRVSQFNTQQSMNQTLVAVLGGIQMANILQDTAMKQEIRDYYASGIDGTNLPVSTGGVRKAARQNVDGYNIFYEVNGFDVSYAGVSLSDLSGIIGAIPDADNAFSDLKLLVKQDGTEMAGYFNTRLAADGWIFAGSRHNEGGSSAFNMGSFSGLSYWGQALKADVGRFLIKSFASTTLTYGDTANLGHIAVHGPVQMHETIQEYPWDRTEQQKLEAYNLRKGAVSAYFKTGSKQPLNISVSGTDFTESLLDTGVNDPDKPGFPKIDRLNGWFAKTADGSLQYDDTKQSTTNIETSNYFMRLDNGVSSNGANTTKQIYLTNGKSLYNVLAVNFGSTQSFLSLGELIGLPYMSVPDRPYVPGTNEPDRVRINGLYATDGTALLDLAQDTGTVTAKAMVAGTARITGFPVLKAQNAPAGGAAKPTWLSKADENILSAGFVTTPGKIMDDLYTKALWDPTNVRSSANNGSIVQFANSDKLSVQLTDSTFAANYQAGDWVYFVSKMEPNIGSTGFTTKAVAKYNGRSDVLHALTIEDEGMKLVLHEVS